MEFDENSSTSNNEKESSAYKFIQQHKNEAMDVSNYQKSITKVLCTADNEKSNMNAYIIGAVVNHYKNYGLTKLEIESLKDMKIWATSSTYMDKWYKYKWCQTKGCERWHRPHREQILYVNFSTKKNWANNQTIYEYEMYRPFRRPDGTIFYLYERQGFFTNEPKVDCADCARDDELNG